jgi:hypothetical protein
MYQLCRNLLFVLSTQQGLAFFPSPVLPMPATHIVAANTRKKQSLLRETNKCRRNIFNNTINIFL